MAILPKRHAASYADCTTPELLLLAEILRSGLSRLSQVLENPGYNIMLHSAPLLRTAADGTVKYSNTKVDYCWHVEIIPRTAMMSGFEIGLGSYMNSVFPEEAARFLRGEVGK
jgi:UDPglucose--hexose-1-phosphate uridylyltransferase